jgi:hypothetical protein
LSATPKLEISVLAAAFALGVLGDALLRCFPSGVNFALWGGLLAAAISRSQLWQAVSAYARALRGACAETTR